MYVGMVQYTDWEPPASCFEDAQTNTGFSNPQKFSVVFFCDWCVPTRTNQHVLEPARERMGTNNTSVLWEEEKEKIQFFQLRTSLFCVRPDKVDSLIKSSSREDGGGPKKTPS